MIKLGKRAGAGGIVLGLGLILGLLLTGCTLITSGTYYLTSGDTVSSWMWGASSNSFGYGRESVERENSITLHSDGIVYIKIYDGFKGSSTTGKYTIDGSNLTISVDEKEIHARLQDGTLSINDNDVTYEYKKKSIEPTYILIFALIFIYLTIATIQGFLAYGLAFREVKKAEGGGDGVSLYFTQMEYGLYAIIPGLVIYMWRKERKEEDKAKEMIGADEKSAIGYSQLLIDYEETVHKSTANEMIEVDEQSIVGHPQPITDDKVAPQKDK